MNNAFATWQHGSHRGAAECADCHLPHQNFVAETAFKIRDGLRHSYVFTFHLEPQVLELSDAAKHVVQENCLRCHANQFMMARLASTTERHCWDCHHGVHGREISLSSTPHAFREPLPPAGLDWMKTLPLQTQEKERSHE
jgi:cytochrome c nitrite reductase small subunit